MESEEYMNRKSREQRGEAEVSILLILLPSVFERERSAGSAYLSKAILLVILVRTFIFITILI